jgi:hypothetical protein
MACAPCAQSRRQAITAATRLDARGFVQAVSRGVAIVTYKARGIDPATVYPTSGAASPATPYRRPVRPGRTK